jgi:hypothetical protein
VQRGNRVDGLVADGDGGVGVTRDRLSPSKLRETLRLRLGRGGAEAIHCLA